MHENNAQNNSSVWSTDAAAFAKLFDHTLLKADARPDQIRLLTAEAAEHGFAGVCINPVYVPLVRRALTRSDVHIVTVIGFPLGAVRTDIKIDEALRAVGDGATELDMVISLGLYLGGEKAAARHDINAVIRAAGNVPVKVILETAHLDSAQIQELSLWSAESGAAFVKTSTGFGPRGASLDDIAAMRLGLQQYPQVQIKASGGIRSLAAVLAFAAAGATRIGSSASVALLDEFRDKRSRA